MVLLTVMLLPLLSIATVFSTTAFVGSATVTTTGPSSSVIVPLAAPPAPLATTTLPAGCTSDKITENVSSYSSMVSPSTTTLNILAEVSPAANWMVSDFAVKSEPATARSSGSTCVEAVTENISCAAESTEIMKLIMPLDSPPELLAMLTTGRSSSVTVTVATFESVPS